MPKSISKISDQTGKISGLPLHLKIEHYLRNLMQEEKYRLGTLLPDELRLANQFGVSRGTVRSALGRLESEGLIERKAGVGTRVKPVREQSGIRAWQSFSGEMMQKGIKVQTYLIEMKQMVAPTEVTEPFGLAADTLLWRLDRLRGWENRPVLHSRSWFHPRLRLTGREDFSQPLYSVLEKETGVKAERALEEFTAVPTSSFLARRLGIPVKQAVLLRRHTVFDSGDRPFEIAEIHYVSSRFTVTLDLRRENP